MNISYHEVVLHFADTTQYLRGLLLGLRISRNFFPLHNINNLIFVMENNYVFCEGGTRLYRLYFN